MQPVDTELLRAINRYRVLDAIRRFAPLSRADICKQTGLGRTTVTDIITALSEEGVVGNAPEGSARGRGRPVEKLQINPDAAFVIGALVAVHQLSIVVTNLKADPLASVNIPIRTTRHPAETVAYMLEDGIKAAVDQAGLSMGQVAGIGVGIPGFIDAAHGISHWSPALGAEPIGFAEMLQKQIGTPVVIENDANMAALAERWFGHGQDIDNFILVTIEGGIGMGLFIHGDLFSGQHGMAAEFGHMKMDMKGGPLCRCGQHGCLEAYAGYYAIVREARKVIELPPTTDEVSIERTAHEVAKRARAGDERLLRIFHEAGETLGVGIANLINVIDPGKVIITGGGVRTADLIEPAVRQAVETYSVQALRGRCEIVFHDWSDEVLARGAAALVLQGLYRNPWSRSTAISVAV